MDKKSQKKAFQQTLEKITQKIIEGYRPEKIILFGSMLDPRRESNDIDLFLIKETDKEQRRIDRAREVRELLGWVDVPLDLIIYTPEEVDWNLKIGNFFIEDIINEGKVVYEAKK